MLVPTHASEQSDGVVGVGQRLSAQHRALPAVTPSSYILESHFPQPLE